MESHVSRTLAPDHLSRTTYAGENITKTQMQSTPNI